MTDKLATALGEFRQDLAEARSGKLRLGFAVTLATGAVTTSGWPATDGVQLYLFLILGALPCAGIGLGLMVTELLHTRADRRGEMRADTREIEALRARIVEDAGGVVLQTVSPGPSQSGFVRPAASCIGSSGPSRPRARAGQLVGGRRRKVLISRGGMLGLR